MRAPFLFLALLPGSLMAQASDTEKADAALAVAMRLAARGGYEQAVSAYRQIARRYPGTPAGAEARERSQPTAFIGWADVERHGPSANRLDVVIMGDGYRLGDQDEFDDIAKVIPKLFKNHKVLGEYYSYHNFLRANLRSKDQGVTGFGRTKDTALGGHVTPSVQGQVGVDMSLARAMLRKVPENDGFAIAIVKAGSMGTGGQGIAAIGGRADKTMIHEWGHAFGDLSDEYTTFTGHRGSPRNGINISNTDERDLVPWRHWIDVRASGIGIHRGADGRQRGAWKPTASGCAMAGGTTFCRVCREALILKIHRYVDPIDACEPEPGSRLTGRQLDFEVTVMKPKTHNLRVSWYVLTRDQAIRTTAVGPFTDRSQRGPLEPIPTRPETFLISPRTRHRFTLSTRRMEPGTYQVICRVIDNAKPSGQQLPWVVRDDRDLLASERAWLVEVK